MRQNFIPLTSYYTTVKRKRGFDTIVHAVIRTAANESTEVPNAQLCSVAQKAHFLVQWN